MNLHRRAGAPRLIEWTGERCVPWAPDVQVVYEHLHRYLWAAELVSGRRVLDLASGEGFGTAILAERAKSVVGVDIDTRTVDHARLNYGLEFEVADALDLSRFEPGSFGAVVAFEMIEHVADHARLLEEIVRVLEPKGLLVVSTPDRLQYSDAGEQDNPFHVHELDTEEFRATLAERFGNVALFGQRTISGSALAAVDEASPGPPARTTFVARSGDEWAPAGPMSPLYLVALASDGPLPRPPSDSVLADCGLELLRSERRVAADEAQRALDETEARHAAEAQAAARTAAAAEERHRAAQEKAERALADRDADLDAVLARQGRLLEEAGEANARIAALEHDLEVRRQMMLQVEQSIAWRAFLTSRHAVYRSIGGEAGLPARALRRGLRGVARRARAASARRRAAGGAPAWEPGGGELIVFPRFAQPPTVSIVIPAYSRADLTRRCLESIRDSTVRVGYEVIVVDDGEDPATKQLLGLVRNAEIIANEENLGYLRSVNRGAAVARGRWLVLANNDVEVQPEWLERLLACGDSSPEIAVVTPKYLYPDGHLNEAGGVIWSDGTGGNYGRGDRTDSWRYEFRRDVDYGSAAALLVRADFWRERGGYDERFEPMYYEDTDLCFDARARGLRVVYEPEANVIHHEGATAGTDITTGHKRHQETNRVKFTEKWNEVLQSEHLPPMSPPTRRATDRGHGPRVLIVDHRVPMPDRDSGSLRMRMMVDSLLSLGARLTFLPDNLAWVHPYTRELQRQGVEVLYPPLDLAAELRELGPMLDLGIVCRPHTASRWLDLIADLAPNARTIYDTVDLHWVREGRRHQLESGSGVSGPRSAVLRELELALVRATDATLVVTEAERDVVRAEVPDADVRVVPNVHRVRVAPPARDGRRGLVFVGSFEHTPNVEAADRLVRRVMPRVWRRDGNLEVTLIGADAPPAIHALASDRVTVAGWVPEIEPRLDAAVALVAPLSYGAGLKGKVTQALAAGLPVVTTSVGAEGLDAVDGGQLLIADTDEELAHRVVRLLDDPELWERLARAGQQLIAERFGVEVMRAQMQDLLARDAVVAAQP